MKTQPSIRSGVSALVFLSALTAPASASAPTFAPLALTVQTETQYCRSRGTQCPTALQPSAAGNRNPTRLVLQVLNGTTPVNGLTDAQIDLSNVIAPAGATRVVQTACPTCFAAVGNGVYVIFASPMDSAVWKSGSYHTQVLVTAGATTYRALTQIEIPY